MNDSKSKKFRRLALVVLLIIFTATVWRYRQYIYDEIKLFGYTPPMTISQIAADDTMTNTARRIFYVNRPDLQARASFSTFCPSGSEQSVVLGCYKGPQRGIYLLEVSNTELAGIQQVTSAHEMLHAAYDRLTSAQRRSIDAKLQNYFDNTLADDDIKKTIEGYRKTEPNDLVNEMHSIIGSQVGDLPADIEQYYSQYFSDRNKVVSYYTAYNKAFTSRKEQIKTYDRQLLSLKKSIDTLQSSVTMQGSNLAAQRTVLERQRTNNDITGYNAGVKGYNAAVADYNLNVRTLKNQVSTYNALVELRNSIAFEEQSLVDSISAPKATER